MWTGPGRRPLLYVVLVLCFPVIWLYTWDRPMYSRILLSSLPSNAFERPGVSASRLRTAFANAPNTSEFGSMGERIAAYASHIKTLMADTRLSRTSLLNLLERDFPWFWPAAPIFLPWSASATATASAHDTTGLVISVGTGNVVFATHLIRSLRNVLQSTLPIQIAYSGDADLSPDGRDQLLQLGPDIEMLDLSRSFNGSLVGLETAGWGQKPFAMLASRFRKVMLVDADVVFLQNPDRTFETQPGLVETGTLFWHDRAFVKDDRSRRDWLRSLMQEKEPSEMLQRSLFWRANAWQEMESGVVCLDKGRPEVFMSLVYAAWMNTEVVRTAQTWQHVHGDKETYWIAAELSSTPYHFEADYGGAIGVLETVVGGGIQKGHRICTSHIAHTDAKRRPFWFNGSFLFNKASTSLQLADFTHWMTGAEDFPDTPAWDMVHATPEGVMCQYGATALPLNGTKYEQLIDDMRHEARNLGWG
ncbi:MAG: hypothetical protein M1838_001118 [Thelocarpon superellum]|nr:MAG: hypothetical protein M1838_001118 [Thelocarpon superellum]